jgi:MFS superfamily sulfate permease-like transporter
MSRIGFVIVDAIPLAIICFTVSFSVAKVFAAKHGYKVDANQVFN